MQLSSFKKLDWITSNIIYWILAITAVIMPSTLALVILTIFTSLFFVLWSIVAITKWIAVVLDVCLPDNSLNELEYPLPKWVVIGSDILLSLLMLGYGHWLLAFLAAAVIYPEYKARTITTFTYKSE